MKAKELRQMTDAELISRHQEFSEELMNLRFQLQMKQLTNPGRIKIVRKDITRINTLLAERERAAQSGG
ncbi:MAG: 50S ribosomal protein L29 [bacterium]|nr:50S ribosomal protein L29 [bacterium]